MGPNQTGCWNPKWDPDHPRVADTGGGRIESGDTPSPHCSSYLYNTTPTNSSNLHRIHDAREPDTSPQGCPRAALCRLRSVYTPLSVDAGNSDRRS